MGKAKPAKGAKAGLLEANGSLTPKFQAVLTEVFTKYDIDRDGGLCLEELEAFARASQSGSKIDESELKQLGQFFETDKNGYLTLKGFQQMFVLQTSQQPADTWRDLANLGYEKTLDLLNSTHGAESAPEAAPAKTAAATDPELMNELRVALSAIKDDPKSAAAHRRVGELLKAMGRDEAAARSLKTAEEIEGSTVDDLD